MIYRFIAYLKFIFTSTNQHGIHSPFIYDFATKCLYKRVYKGPKTIGVLLKSIAYFKANSVHITSKHMNIQSQVKNAFPQIEFDDYPCDIMYFDCPNTELFHGGTEDGLYHNNTMIMVKSIHQNKENNDIWELMKGNEKVTVSVDLFYCGVLFFRKEQAKEHFKIRL
ncbi:MAG: hypothetical protein WBM77_15330 [Maribacter sp.]